MLLILNRKPNEQFGKQFGSPVVRCLLALVGMLPSVQGCDRGAGEEKYIHPKFESATQTSKADVLVHAISKWNLYVKGIIRTVRQYTYDTELQSVGSS